MYKPRIVDAILKDRLQSAGAVLIEGAKACGKTETARQIAASEVLLDIDPQARAAIGVDASLVLEGETPRLIDEWQSEPDIWNHIRREVDRRKTPGQFILTGSAVPADDIIRHTGAGRISRLKLSTMSSFEVGFSSGAISLGRLFGGEFSATLDTGHRVSDVAEFIARGGWPANLDLSLNASLASQRDYLEEIERVDVARVDGVRRDPANVARVIRSLARNVATPVTARTLAADAGGADGPFDDDTVRAYLRALSRLMIVEEQPAWSPHLRSRSILRKSPKRHLVDPSLAVAALGANVDRLLKDLELLALLFESLVARDLRVYAQPLDATLYHYQDNTGLEVDAVLEDRGGNWCAFEIKLGSGQIDAAAMNLRKFRERIDTMKIGEPRLLGIIVSHGYGYMRDDGIAVIPLGALGP